MSTIPKNRIDLIDLIQINFQKLDEELKHSDSEIQNSYIEGDWTVKELLAIRCWWTEAVIKWVKSGQNGRVPVTPTREYSWKETPKLNQEIAANSKSVPYETIRKKLRRSYLNLFKLIDSLDDRELLDKGVFEWAGDSWPISRWISVNTARQYATARSYVRKIKRLG